MPQIRHGRVIAYATTTLLAGQVLAHALMVIAAMLEAFALGARTEDAADSPLALVTAGLQVVGGLGQFAAWIATVVAFIMWFHRAATNAAVIAREPLRLGPGWAIGGWFVPLLNLVRPYEVAREIEKASGAELPSGLIGAWWGAFLVSNLLANVEAAATAVDAGAIASLISAAATGVAAFFCVRVMFYIEGLQANPMRAAEELARVFE